MASDQILQASWVGPREALELLALPGHEGRLQTHRKANKGCLNPNTCELARGGSSSVQDGLSELYRV